MERLSLSARRGLAAVAGILLPFALIYFGLEVRAPEAVVGGVILAMIGLIAAVHTRLWSRFNDASTLDQWVAAGVLAVGLVTVAVVAAILAAMVAIIALVCGVFRVLGRSRD